MAKTSIYINFNGNAEEAFHYYQKVFNTTFSEPIMRMGDLKIPEGMPEFSAAEKQKVMHVALPILGGTEIMGSDILERLGHYLTEGNNLSINLHADSREEVDRLYKMLNNGSQEGVAPHDEPWGYWATCKDKFGVRWMFNGPFES